MIERPKPPEGYKTCINWLLDDALQSPRTREGLVAICEAMHEWLVLQDKAAKWDAICKPSDWQYTCGITGRSRITGQRATDPKIPQAEISDSRET